MEQESTRSRIEMRGISKAFPGVQALSNVSIRVQQGEIRALVGENGAGKSTLMKILSGAYERDSGEMFLDGVQIDINTPADALRLGIVVIYQESSLSPELSVAENIFCGRLPTRGPFVDWKTLYRSTQAVLNELNSEIDPKAVTKSLSVAQCQIVEIAKALSIDARTIVFDEPTAALTAGETETLFSVMRKLKQDGISIIFITHRLAEIFQIADSITILRDGASEATMNVSDASEEKIIYGMVGRKVLPPYPKDANVRLKPLLEIEDLSGTRFSHVSLKVLAGEIVGLFGLVGSGRTELVRAVFGADRFTSGGIRLEGRRCVFSGPSEAIDTGVVLVPEDRKAQGLVLGMSVRNNISLPSIWSLSVAGFIQKTSEATLAESFREKLDIRCPGIGTRVLSLSGGNQQKVVIAKWLAKKPRLLIVDEPTRGIDVGAKAEVHNLIIDLANRGVGVLVVSSELPEILRISDRIYVMHEGNLVGEVTREEATEELIMSFASGR